jgi:hypothetical protein
LVHKTELSNVSKTTKDSNYLYYNLGVITSRESEDAGYIPRSHTDWAIRHTADEQHGYCDSYVIVLG